MTDQKTSHGGCLCGAVTLLATTVKPMVGACHCNMCRKWVGGPFMAVDCGSEVGFIGHEYIGRYASSEWAERGFCTQCGSALFYKLKESGQYMLAAGILDLENQLHFDHQVFIDEKPNYYCFSNKTKNMTGAELFALYGAE
ncbi:GFA family protein [Marinicella litoralis]|uniref:CENP-V/GFA domain-containing protein n=1 Tax=Marinicella litoralis TaxID=644220 RepID=A0A4R6XKM5_9GAMM|nr:GFA family protein [Marinicella litoralis]TDR18454.1 hypothetical protein C8D91_2374 [Marinicella litoralis]